MKHQHHFLFFGLTSWDSLPQREQGLAVECARQGNKVDFIELPPSFAGRLQGLRNRAFSPLSRDTGFNRGSAPPNLRLLTPPMLPTGFRNSLTPAIDRVIFRRWFTATFKDVDFKSVIGVIMLPLWWGVFLERDIFDPGFLIYDIADSLEVQSRNADTLARLRDCEHRLSRETDLVTYSAHEMDREVNILFPGVPSLFLPNAVSRDFIDHLDAAEPPESGRKQEIGYVGATNGKWFDPDLVIEVLRAFPECTLSIIGPVDKRFAERCARYPNAKLHGFVEHNALAGHLRRFDVAIIPFKRNGITRIVNPLKLYEYAAAQLPIIASWTEELCNYQPLVTLAHDTAEFVECIGVALREQDDELRNKRRNFALANTWTERIHRLTAMLERQVSAV